MLPGSSFSRALREAAPRLSRRLFSCQCQQLRQHQLFGEARSAFRRHASTSPPRSSRQRVRLGMKEKRLSQSIRAFSFTVIRRLEKDTAQGIKSTKSSRWPQTNSNVVAYWLLGSAASVFGIVVFGGLTRLTESGLSITEWKPVTGSLPPMSEGDWASEFFKYQSSPEFSLLNSRMTLDEFKSIYWMEWIHRLWGRAIGLTFVLPATYFIARRHVTKRMSFGLLGIASMIGFQGFLGWWMVKSGLKDDLFAPGSHPRVSQYRLTAHLGAAFAVYLTMLTSGLSILRTNRILSLPASTAATTLSQLRNPSLIPFKRATTLLCGLLFVTAMSGALVAGLDAGLIYNEFPYMGLGLTPPKSELFDPWYSRSMSSGLDGRRSDLVWRNMCENPSLVQLDHRIMATTAFTYIMGLFAWSRFSPVLKAALPRAAARGVHGVMGFVCLQVTLGISTLLYLVPTPLASLHQAGALALLSWSFVLGGRVWFPKAAARILEGRLLGTRQAMSGTTAVSQPVEGVRAPNGSGAGVVMAGMIPLVGLGSLASMPVGKNMEVVTDVEIEKQRFLAKQMDMGVGRAS